MPELPLRVAGGPGVLHSRTQEERGVIGTACRRQPAGHMRGSAVTAVTQGAAERVARLLSKKRAIGDQGGTT